MVLVICPTEMRFEKLQVLIYVSAALKSFPSLKKKSLFGNHFLLSLLLCFSSRVISSVCVIVGRERSLLTVPKAVQPSSPSFPAQPVPSIVQSPQPGVVKGHENVVGRGIRATPCRGSANCKCPGKGLTS